VSFRIAASTIDRLASYRGAVAAIATGEREGWEQPWHAVIEDGEVLPASLVAERAGGRSKDCAARE
jgi:hypothetical protein